MKIAFRIVLVLTVLPVVLTLVGLLLSSYYDCSGMEHIEYCAPGAPRQLVVGLLACGWLSIFVVPTGLIVLALLGLAGLIRAKLNRNKRPGDAGVRKA